ncbi:TPA: phage tail protein [Citrobacter gillenii]
MGKYIWSAKHGAFFPVILQHIYENDDWDLSDAVSVDNTVAQEFQGEPPKGKIRCVGQDGMPKWKDIL